MDFTDSKTCTQYSIYSRALVIWIEHKAKNLLLKLFAKSATAWWSVIFIKCMQMYNRLYFSLNLKPIAEYLMRRHPVVTTLVEAVISFIMFRNAHDSRSLAGDMLKLFNQPYNVTKSRKLIFSICNFLFKFFFVCVQPACCTCTFFAFLSH